MTKAQEIRYDRSYQAENDIIAENIFGVVYGLKPLLVHSQTGDGYTYFYLDAKGKRIIRYHDGKKTFELSDRVKIPMGEKIKRILSKK